MVQDAVLVTFIGLAAFFLLIPASIWLLKSALGGEEPAEPADDVETNGDRPRQGPSA
ncbi:hypothetical protein [Halorientalis sp. IM1011]|uniref:hypothetical protein n=1 Tax=Halorientalis sp. IM1011 TaxID=1932360 RepID=UPI0012FB9CF4|nr:hypothetical protein [Halorientalis sp. IM1011]